MLFRPSYSSYVFKNWRECTDTSAKHFVTTKSRFGCLSEEHTVERRLALNFSLRFDSYSIWEFEFIPRVSA